MNSYAEAILANGIYSDEANIKEICTQAHNLFELSFILTSIGKDLESHLLDWYFLLIYMSLCTARRLKVMRQQEPPTNPHKCVWWLTTMVVCNDESRAPVTTGKFNYMSAGAVKSTEGYCWPTQCGLNCGHAMLSQTFCLHCSALKDEMI